jgi:hypothetical protein
VSKVLLQEAGPSGTYESWTAGDQHVTSLAPVLAGASRCKAPRAQSRRSWVLLDASWAKQLGVTRTGAGYRISRRELVRRLAMAELEGTSTTIGQNAELAGGASSSTNGRVQDRSAA